MKRPTPGLWGHRPMRSLERRLYSALSQYLNRLAIQAYQNWIADLHDETRWQDDGGLTP